jgi:hypothetical protein
MKLILQLFVALAIAASSLANSKDYNANDAFGCNSFESHADQCWDDASRRRLQSFEAMLDADVCDCFKTFNVLTGCERKQGFKIQGYLDNGCALPAEEWTAPATDSNDFLMNPPCLQDCSKNLGNPGDTCSVAEICGANYENDASCEWYEKSHIYTLKEQCKPDCQFQDYTCIGNLYSAKPTYNACAALEQCQQNNCNVGSDYYNMVESRREKCACVHGFTKAPSNKRCDPIDRKVARVLYHQVLHVNASVFDSSTFKDEGPPTNPQKSFKNYVATKMFPSDILVNTYQDIDVIDATVENLTSGVEGIEFDFRVTETIQNSDDPMVLSQRANEAAERIGLILTDSSYLTGMQQAFNDDDFFGVTALATSSGKGSKIEFDRTSVPTAAPTNAPAEKESYTNSPTIIFIGGASVIMVLFCFFFSGHRSTAKAIEGPHHHRQPTVSRSVPSAAGAETRTRSPTPAPKQMVRTDLPLPPAPASNDAPAAATPPPASPPKVKVRA